MGPDGIKKDIYNVMTSSRELANFCQESVKSFQSKKISDSLNNFHLETSIDFIIKSLTHENQFPFKLNELDYDDLIVSDDEPTYSKVIDYIETYLVDSNL
tara:strand:- start:496 stop:795 length:300 start_codon:yes stop_codon:yes gene_type:complete